MARNQIVFICGKKGSGKTTLAASLVDRIHASGRRLIVVDPMSGFRLPGAPIIRRPDPVEFERLAGRSALIRPESIDLVRMAVKFAWHAQESPSRDLWLVIDELQGILSWRSPDPDLLGIVQYGRHRKISLIGICQRPAQVHNDFLANADKRIIFQVEEPNDLAYLKRYVGVEPEALRSQAVGQYLVR